MSFTSVVIKLGSEWFEFELVHGSIRVRLTLSVIFSAL